MARRLRSRSLVTTVVTISSSSSEDERNDGGSESESNSGGEDTVAQASPLSSTPCTSRTRKRVRRSITWKKNVRKRRRNAGLRYTSDTTNNVVR